MPPLTPAVFHVLLALAEGRRHGYAILKDVERQTAGAVRMGPGTLYGTLQRLMDLGLVEEASPPARTVDQRRRYYHLSRGGRAALAAEVERMELLLRTARARHVAVKPARG
jgi:DNA-binding PadR family transcriptional regulator